MLGTSVKPLLIDIDDAAAIALARELATNTTATELDLCGQRMGDDGATALAAALETNGTLAMLDLAMNQIGVQGATALLRVIQAKKNTTLESLDLSGNLEEVGSELLSKIANALESNQLANKPFSKGGAPRRTPQGRAAEDAAPSDKSQRDGDVSGTASAQVHDEKEDQDDCLTALLAAHGIELTSRADGETARSRESLALLQVAQSGHAVAMRALLSAEELSIDVNATDSSGFTALMVAADGGWPPIVTALLAVEGINVNLVNAEGCTALVLAAEEGQTAIVRALLDVQGIDVNVASSESGATALVLAAQEGHSAVVEALLASDAGVDINAAEHRGWTAINRAAQGGHVAIVSALMRVPGIDVNAAGEGGWTPLMSAASLGHDGVLRALRAAPSVNVCGS